MKIVLHSLKEMEASLLENESELEALEQIDILRERLQNRPGAAEILERLQEECAPGAEKTKMELEMIRDAIQILEDQEIVPEPELEPDFQTESLPEVESEQLAIAQPA